MDKKNNIEELQNDYPLFFEAFPLPIIEFALSEITAKKIANICIENKIIDQEKVAGIGYRTAYVIFNKLPKEGLMITIRDGLDVEEEIAKKITKSIDEIILSQIPKIIEEKNTEVEEKKETPIIEEKEESKDVYRESF